jgi:prepilin signal peptidase PulO-like enzyme (type II secretory pathway)
MTFTLIHLLAILFLVFGLIIGSFLNVVICRLNTQRFFKGRSACMSCQNQLCWYELIPLASFLVLRGRCKNCQSKISVIYPFVEALTGLIFVVLFFKLRDIFFVSTFMFVIAYVYYATIFSIFIVIAVYDFRHKIIPDILSFLLGAIAFIGLFLFDSSSLLPYIFYLHLPSILEFSSGVLIALPFALLWLFSRGAWMGLGDAKLILGLGWFLGLSLALSAVTMAFWVGAIVGVYLIMFRKSYSIKSEIPFAVYLFIGTLVAFFLEIHIFGF